MAVLSSAAPGAPPIGLNEANIRKFVAAQGRFWNARDFTHFYATFDPRAAIVTVHRTKNGRPVRSARTLVQDREAAEKLFASSHADIRETDRIEHIAIGAAGRRATVRVRETATIKVHGKVKVLLAVTEQVLVWRKGGIVSLGLTEWDDR